MIYWTGKTILQLFILYTSELGDVMRRFNIQFHLYADDTQLYLPFNPRDHSSVDDATALLRSCLNEVRDWMRDNYLQLNADKTEILLVSTKPGLQTCNIDYLSIANLQVSPASSVKNLGVMLDSFLKMEGHVNAVSKSAFFHLRNIARIRQFPNFTKFQVIWCTCKDIMGIYLIFGKFGKKCGVG